MLLKYVWWILNSGRLLQVSTSKFFRLLGKKFRTKYHGLNRLILVHINKFKNLSDRFFLKFFDFFFSPAGEISFPLQFAIERSLSHAPGKIFQILTKNKSCSKSMPNDEIIFLTKKIFFRKFFIWNFFFRRYDFFFLLGNPIQKFWSEKILRSEKKNFFLRIDAKSQIHLPQKKIFFS